MRKSVLLSIAILFGVSQLRAEDRITIDNFTTVAAGETVDVNINLENTDHLYGGLQFDLYLPDGVTIVTTSSGALWCKPTDRLKYKDDFDETQSMSTGVSQKDDGCYSFLVYNIAEKEISGNSGAIFTIRLQASDAISTTGNVVKIKNQVLSTVGAVQYTPADKEDYPCTLQVPAKIAASGYGSFSWPRALDFSGTGTTVFVGTQTSDGWLHLESVDNGKIPANTGVVLKGPASSTVYPQTIDETVTLSQTNLLKGTAEAAVAVTEAGYYALSTKTAGTGFYLIDETKNVTIPQYKAYLQTNGGDGAREAFFFAEGTTGLTVSETEAAEDGAVYDLQGRRVDSLAKGIYVKDGRKIIVK